jgi:DNA-binding response OmpR family regulator
MRALIVDDDETFCQLLTEVLERKGIEAVWTTDSLSGYEMSLGYPYDFFILDVRMPLLLGTELTEELKKENPGAKIILISAFADESLLETSKNLGAPLLSKPFSPDRLLRVISQILGPQTGKAENNLV